MKKCFRCGRASEFLAEFSQFKHSDNELEIHYMCFDCWMMNAVNMTRDAKLLRQSIIAAWPELCTSVGGIACNSVTDNTVICIVCGARVLAVTYEGGSLHDYINDYPRYGAHKPLPVKKRNALIMDQEIREFITNALMLQKLGLVDLAYE